MKLCFETQGCRIFCFEVFLIDWAKIFTFEHFRQIKWTELFIKTIQKIQKQPNFFEKLLE